MKKIIFTLLISLFTYVGNAQKVYRAVTAELYRIGTNQEWVLDTKLSDLKIDITVEDEFISIHAKSPTMYRIFVNSKESLSTKTLRGYRYDGVDLKLNENIKVDILKSIESNLGIISIINSNKGFNFRYFIETE